MASPEVLQTPYTRYATQIEERGNTLLGVLNSGDRKSLSRLLAQLNVAFLASDSEAVEQAWEPVRVFLNQNANKYQRCSGHFFALRTTYQEFCVALSNQAPEATDPKSEEVIPLRARTANGVTSTLNS